MEGKKIKHEHEWFIYSSVAITCSLLFVSIELFTGTPQILGAAMSPVVGGAFALSGNWKSLSPAVHKYFIAISISLIFLVAGILYYKKEIIMFIKSSLKIK